ncbi:hypothetical protein CE143_15450 [Photorhabdus luminescens]|uniref:Transposase n=1 Tax=Photorhabdus akhurstii TaxID=171438 RepID=A0ABX8LXY9_9GAMM|nr:hypothetical protein B0X70_15455 [Photorhabdus akhurstii]UJD76213.1 hypothetical protein CE143_15450 [Photorhabdus luminescens]
MKPLRCSNIPLILNWLRKKQALLLEWKKYLVLLNCVDTSLAPDIKWLGMPE